MSLLCISLLPVAGYFGNREVPSAAYTPHETIVINGDDDLANFCSLGNGTLENPYIIENYDISGNTTGISIINTNAFLCIQNNQISNQTSGIFIYNAQNINISGNNLFNATNSIDISKSENIAISGNTITNSTTGIRCVESINVNVHGNNIENMVNFGLFMRLLNYSHFSENIFDCCNHGIGIFEDNLNNTFSNNSFTQCGFYFLELVENYSIDTLNKVNGKTVLYFEQQTNVSILNQDVGQLILMGVNNSEFRGLNVSRGIIGITCFNSHNNAFSDIISSYNNFAGFNLGGSSNNLISLCQFEGNKYGIIMTTSSNNVVAGNLIKKNEFFGINIYGSNFNRIYYNSFMSNADHVNIGTHTHEFDNGRRGNYWDDYELKYPSATHNGTVWNTGYLIDEFDMDEYPLAYIPFTQFGAPILTTPSNKSSNGTIRLQWNAILEAEYYLVYRSNSVIPSIDELTPIANTTAIEFTETVVEGTYFYVVVAVNEFQTSGISNNVNIGYSAQPQDPEQPDDDTDPGDQDQDQDDDNKPSNLQVDGFPLAIFGVICIVSLMIKKRRIST